MDKRKTRISIQLQHVHTAILDTNQTRFDLRGQDLMMMNAYPGLSQHLCMPMFARSVLLQSAGHHTQLRYRDT